MSKLQDQINDIDDDIKELTQKKQIAISEAARTFEHLEKTDRMYGLSGDRYFILRADGYPIAMSAVYRQKPAAERTFKQYCNVYGGNVFLYDKKLGTVVDQNGTVVAKMLPDK